MFAAVNAFLQTMLGTFASQLLINPHFTSNTRQLVYEVK
jgi:hypothetical protein